MDSYNAANASNLKCSPIMISVLFLWINRYILIFASSNDRWYYLNSNQTFIPSDVN
jgi:hypothetical protein